MTSSVLSLRPIFGKKTNFSRVFYTMIIVMFFVLPYYKIVHFHNEHPMDPNLKYILLWTPWVWPPFSYFGKGQESFKEYECEFTNCFVSADRFLLGDLTKFHAIAFNGRNMMKISSSKDLPLWRSPHQKYIYFNTESSVYETICNPRYEGFYNWTCSYKLNSDIVTTYINIKDVNGTVGPSIDMNWIKEMKEINDEFKEKLKSKRKAAVWFVSRCETKSKREWYAKLLGLALQIRGLTLDVYGICGPYTCERYEERCNDMVASDYYFYLAFENSFAEDYVTEKLLTALNNRAVPIVYGGANYTRFLPPGSYIDARAYTPLTLAAIMADIITTPRKYHDFFRWTNHYSFSESLERDTVCNVCAALNDKKKLTHSSHTQFRTWWNPRWKDECGRSLKADSPITESVKFGSPLTQSDGAECSNKLS